MIDRLFDMIIGFGFALMLMTIVVIKNEVLSEFFQAIGKDVPTRFEVVCPLERDNQVVCHVNKGGNQ